jgi:hypothetical protein
MDDMTMGMGQRQLLIDQLQKENFSLKMRIYYLLEQKPVDQDQFQEQIEYQVVMEKLVSDLEASNSELDQAKQRIVDLEKKVREQQQEIATFRDLADKSDKLVVTLKSKIYNDDYYRNDKSYNDSKNDQSYASENHKIRPHFESANYPHRDPSHFTRIDSPEYGAKPVVLDRELQMSHQRIMDLQRELFQLQIHNNEYARQGLKSTISVFTNTETVMVDKSFNTVNNEVDRGIQASILSANNQTQTTRTKLDLIVQKIYSENVRLINLESRPESRP